MKKHMTTKPKKILCVSVSVGSGHVRAGDAIAKALRAKGHTVTHLDMMDYVSGAYKAAMVRAYGMLVKQAPSVWGLIYNGTNSDVDHSQIAKVSNRLADLNASKFIKKVREISPEYVIGTHYLPTQAIAMHRQELGITTPVSLVLTDYDKHSFLISPHIDHYFVATSKMQFKLTEAGIPANHVTVSGIPIDSAFFVPFDQKMLKKEHGYTPGNPLFLVLGGGGGMANLTQIVETLFRLPYQASVVAVAGNNTTLKEELLALSAPSHIQYTALGWTNELDVYMKMADVVITKPGGMTTTECITLRKPIIAIQPIPGQEEHNAEFILERGFGVAARSLSDLLYYLTKEKDTLGHGYESYPFLPKTSVDVIIEKLLL